MSEVIKPGIVRIFSKSYRQVVGVGFLVAAEGNNNIILTCAHVINRAISKSSDSRAKPRVQICIDFPYLSTQPRLKAQVIAYFPKADKASDDVAVLKLVSRLPVPETAKAIRLRYSQSFNGHDFGVYGFPEDYEKSGTYVEGLLQERLADEHVQARGITNLAFFVEEGFSGSPVFDKQLDAVMGMIKRVDADPNRRVTFVSPIDVIALRYPKLEIETIWPARPPPPAPPPPYIKAWLWVDTQISGIEGSLNGVQGYRRIGGNLANAISMLMNETGSSIFCVISKMRIDANNEYGFRTYSHSLWRLANRPMKILNLVVDPDSCKVKAIYDYDSSMIAPPYFQKTVNLPITSNTTLQDILNEILDG